MVDLCLQISSDFKYYFGCVNGKFLSLGLLQKLDVSTLKARLHGEFQPGLKFQPG